jgi:hypothetical protein
MDWGVSPEVAARRNMPRSVRVKKARKGLFMAQLLSRMFLATIE